MAVVFANDVASEAANDLAFTLPVSGAFLEITKCRFVAAPSDDGNVIQGQHQLADCRIGLAESGWFCHWMHGWGKRHRASQKRTLNGFASDRRLRGSASLQPSMLQSDQRRCPFGDKAFQFLVMGDDLPMQPQASPLLQKPMESPYYWIERRRRGGSRRFSTDMIQCIAQISRCIDDQLLQHHHRV